MSYKQSNIFDYWAPNNGKTKIADFGKNISNIKSPINNNKNVVSEINSNPINTIDNFQNSISAESKNNNKWLWLSLIGGVILIGCGIYLFNRYKIIEREKDKDFKCKR